MNPEGARLGQNTRSKKGAVLRDGAFARRGQSPVAHIRHQISFHCVCVCGWGYERSTVSERKVGQGRLAHIHGLMCLGDILDVFDPEVHRPESRLRRNGYIISLTTKMLFLFSRNQTYEMCLGSIPLDHGTNSSFVVSSQ